MKDLEKTIEHTASGAESSWVEVNRKDGTVYWCETKDGQTVRTVIKEVK